MIDTDTNTESLQQDYLNIRSTTLTLTDGLSEEDMVVQSMEDASPTKWHLAHTTWFFETFVLATYQRNYQVVNPDYGFLFNSYYESVGKRHARPLRGMLTRPGLSEIKAYRHTIDEKIITLLDQPSPRLKSTADTITVGLHHEMQHQELLMTDILHALSVNPTYPAIRKNPVSTTATAAAELNFTAMDGGIHEIGASDCGFSFDCEGPFHQTYLQPYAIANRPISNGEWLTFMADGGYTTPTLWLSDGWARCQRESWQAPLYWVKQADQWQQFGFNGLQDLDLNAPVCHISYFEADAFAQWSGYRLPSEQEWEVAAKQQPVAGNLLENNYWKPRPAPLPDKHELTPKHKSTAVRNPQQLYGDVWEWTRSPYSPYPGFKSAAGAIGEYNGKFMCGQFVLRGGSCVTPAKQLRPSYRNFFYPHQRWQFSGLRLAKDIP